MQILNLRFLIIGYNPFLSIRKNISNRLSSGNELSFLQRTTTELSITGSYHNRIRQIQACHFKCRRCPLNSSFGTHTTIRHLIHTGKGSFLLSFHSFQLLTRSLIIRNNLFKLDRSRCISFHQIFISFPVFLQFSQAHFDFSNRGIIDGCSGLCSIQRGINYCGTGLRILQCGFGFHYPDFIFTIVEHHQSIPFMYLLMLGKVNLINISRSTQVDRRYILLDLGIVAGFRLAIIQKETNHFNYSPDNNSHS